MRLFTHAQSIPPTPPSATRRPLDQTLPVREPIIGRLFERPLGIKINPKFKIS